MASDVVIPVIPAYCTQYNSTEKYDLYFDKSKISSLGKEQYLLKDFVKTIPEGARLDYYIKFLHIAKGLCYYENVEQAEMSLANYLSVYTNDNFEDLRYVKTVNCYYMYKKYLYDDPKNMNQLKPPCNNNFVTYFNVVLYFFQNETYCPYPQKENTVSLGSNAVIDKARNDFLIDLQNLYETEVKQNEDCEDPFNEEIVNCGYQNNLKKQEYCRNYRDECCNYKSLIESKLLIKYVPSLTAIIIGSSTTVVFLILGMLFSYNAIKDIKTKERIEEAVAKQEQMYKDKQQGRRGSGYSSDPNSLRPPSLMSSHHSLPKSQNSDNRAIRSPQPLPVSPADFSNYNSNTNLLGSNNNIASSSSANNLQQRASSLYSQSSVDLSSEYNIPLEIPISPYLDPNSLANERRTSSIVDYPSSKRERPISLIDRPPRSTPVLECPGTPNLNTPGSPYLQNAGSRPGTPNLNTPGSPYLQNAGSRPGTPNLNSQSPMSPSFRERRPSSIIDRPPRTPELERPTTPKINYPSTPKLELPPSSP